MDFDQALRDQQQLYDRGWSLALEQGKEQRGNLQTNLEFLAQTGAIQAGQRWLEVGCGIGTVCHHVRQLGCTVIGTDISNEAIAYGRSKFPGLDLRVGPAESLDFEDACFDGVLSFDLIEHIARVDDHLDEVRRVLRPGGCYLFQTPNKLSNTVFETLNHRSLRWRRYHPSLHTVGQLRRRFRRHGFELELVKMNPINAFTAVKFQRLGRLGRWICRIDFSRLPFWMQTNLYGKAVKPCDC